jgi:H+/gluconate symporter-like permease
VGILAILAVLISLGLLMWVAYRGFSVILFAPICALLAVVLSGNIDQILPFFTGVFMVKMVEFIKLYFPIFLLGAVFGKVIELSGSAHSISKLIIHIVGEKRAILAIVLAGAVLTYGGVSVFVAVFALYPFASSLFREANIPKRLIPGTIGLGIFTVSMDALPGTPQIQNVIPTSFFGTNLYAAPILGIMGSLIIITFGVLYLEWRKKQAVQAGEGYGTGHINEPESSDQQNLPHWSIALLPLIAVGVANKVLTTVIPNWYANGFNFETIGLKAKDYPPIEIKKVAGIWGLEIALVIGILLVLVFNFQHIRRTLQTGLNTGIAGSLLATINTASEYGYGAVIAALPGFALVKQGLTTFSGNPLINEAVSINILAGMTGSASGGLSIALASIGQDVLTKANAMGIDPEVLHRVASMAAGGMDTLPHNGAIITLLAITGLTHRQSYKDIFALTIIKTLTVFVVIALYMIFGIK